MSTTTNAIAGTLTSTGLKAALVVMINRRLTYSYTLHVRSCHNIDYDCTRSKPVSVVGNIPTIVLVAVDMHISQTAKTLTVVFKLFSTNQEKITDRIASHAYQSGL